VERYAIDYRYIGRCILFLFAKELKVQKERAREREKKRKGRRDLTKLYLVIEKPERKKEERERTKFIFV